MNRIAVILALAAGIACAAFGYEPPRHNDTFTTNGVTYAQRGGLGASDYVVTNIDASAVGKVQSVNGKTGDVVLNAQDVGAATAAQGAKADGALQRTGGTMTGRLTADTINFGIHDIGDYGNALGIYNTLVKRLLVIPESNRTIDYLALLSDVYAAVQQIAPAFTAKAYALDELCTHNGVVYRCKSAYTATASSTNPESDRTHWEAKTVSEVFARLSDIAAAQSAIAAAAQSATNYTDSAVNAVEQTVPNNITRTANSATLIHCDSGNCTNELVLIRQASTSLAGLMTAADKSKLNSIDPSLYALKNGSSDITISKSNPTITLRPASGILGGSSTTYGNGSIASGVAGMEKTYYFPETGGTLATTDDIPTDEIANLAEAVNVVSNDNVATRAIVTTWENFLDGSNVVFSITNYISGAYTLDTAKLKILELKDGAYQEVYNSRDEILLHIQDFKDNDFKNATNQVIGAVNAAIGNKADRDWGKYTSAGGEAPENTVYMTAPNTVFAGGLEYERVAVGEGTICVLTTHGAPVWTQGDEGTFKFQDDGGTNYFGFAKTDSYTIGANTDGITVSGGMVTMTYNITMSGRPCVWYKADLTSDTPWEQLNLPDGSPVAGASHTVTWEQNPPAGTQVCYINVGNQPQGFFRATVEVAGEAKFMTNMPADLSGGIICTNTATGVNGVIKPTFNGTTVQWTWCAQ